MFFSPKKLIPLLLMIWATQLFIANLTVAYAANLYDVVINEIAWAGSLDNSRDEWIELFNNTNAEIDLSGWQIERNTTTTYTITEGKIPAKGFFLIERNEDAVLNINADFIVSLTLANTGDTLILKDSTGKVIDSVNSARTMWPAGSNTSKGTMERVSSTSSGEDASNWKTAIFSNGSVSSLSSPILGTPKSINSNAMTTGMEVVIDPSNSNASVGEVKTFDVNVKEAEDLYAYGFEIIYDAEKLEFVSMQEGEFLKKDGKNASFLYALENNQAGKLLVASSRLENPPTGVSGAGKLFSMQFRVVDDLANSTSIIFGPNSFVSDVQAHQVAKYEPANIGDSQTSIGIVKNPRVEEGDSVYTLRVIWTAPDTGADQYIVSRKMPNGSFETISQSSNTDSLDSISVSTGINYEYRIVAVLNGVSGGQATITGSESRGVRGDIDKNFRVDGRDLELLARSYGDSYGQQNYNINADLNYDGVIDGEDLIILGAHFGLTY